VTNLDIEKIGTKLVIEFEKEQGREILQQKYKGCGWDLCTSNDKETRFIEIKTSKSKKLVGRWIEKHGFEQLQNNPNFWVYSVTECKEDGTGIVKTYKGSDLQYKEEVKYVLSFP
jgi:Holliday junction resolvase-like predicted endonuclease